MVCTCIQAWPVYYTDIRPYWGTEKLGSVSEGEVAYFFYLELTGGLS